MKRLDSKTSIETIVSTSKLICSAWPGRALRDRVEGIQKDISESNGKLFPAHYVLMEKGDIVVAHAKLVESETKREVGRSVCVYDVVVDQKKRRKGYGKKLMSGLEPIVKDMGYHYIYLTTSPKLASNFYKKCGYREHDAVTKKRKVFRKMAEGGLARLEALFETRNKQKVVEKIESNSVWLRKRVVERYFTKSSPLVTSFDDLNRVVKDRVTHLMSDRRVTAILRNNLTFRQIGPSCGLCALAMAYCVITKHTMKMPLPDKLKDLYKIAKQRNFTWEGEMFRIDELLEMARTLVASSNVKLSEITLLSPCDVVNILLSGGTIVVPYDSMFGNYEPALHKGSRSHYCVVVGFVWNNKSSEGYESFNLSQLDEKDCAVNTTHIENLHVVYQQSGSNQACVCPWNQLVCSNTQLDNQSKHRKETLERKYCVGAGIRLSNKCLIFTS